MRPEFKGRRAILCFIQKSLSNCPQQPLLLLTCCSMNYLTGGVYRQHKTTSCFHNNDVFFHFITNMRWHSSITADEEGDEQELDASMHFLLIIREGNERKNSFDPRCNLCCFQHGRFSLMESWVLL